MSLLAGREDAMAGYVRATLAGGDASKIEAMAADVAAHPDAGAVALRHGIKFRIYDFDVKIQSKIVNPKK